MYPILWQYFDQENEACIHWNGGTAILGQPLVSHCRWRFFFYHEISLLYVWFYNLCLLNSNPPFWLVESLIDCFLCTILYHSCYFTPKKDPNCWSLQVRKKLLKLLPMLELGSPQKITSHAPLAGPGGCLPEFGGCAVAHRGELWGNHRCPWGVLVHPLVI